MVLHRRLLHPLSVSNSSPTVLVIEDDAAVRSLMTRVLLYSQFNVIEAATGEEGVAMAAERRPDAVVCDFHLPGMNGLRILERLRAGPATFDTPVVMISGKPVEAQTMSALFLCTEFLPKPFLISDLVASLRKLTSPRTREHSTANDASIAKTD